MLKKLVIIPTYNEVENIEKIIRISLNLPDDFHILVVDDSSPDGTYQKVKELMSEFSERLFLEIRQEKNGLGKAYIHGFKWALENQYDFIFEMDADFSHNPQDLPRLSQALENGVDIAIGSRYSQGVNVVNWPMKRVLLSYFASKYVQLITNLPVHDTTAGFVGYKKQVLEKINLDEIEFKGYGFQIEMKYKAWKKNFILQEVPIIFTDRTLGESKISNNIVKEAVLGVIKLRWKFMTGRL
ncbi:Undecaprenyl-phosphate 4-deoxy-4-formamido-L-arabinose transferase [Candidatus Ornithobacterium hominis]|uniref:polyprenol monophosphomannose synthase n=1 Tax=Candidatus Ornithobacterium hominis TaxID=2497989 RepID=UPI000E5C1CBC|nr:polyprenol monophosphomannose synthase [Candidatus Ornithobacterium hominis]SZD71997.1 Undecaprenyl-phosphate 4-deoxy-4-formamido-L-arabinose transferase [Candidatus Ornithobacterium hominis]